MRYSVQITDQFSGKIDLAEKYLGTGIGAGTYTWWKLFGLILCILSVLWLFNLLPSGLGSSQTAAPTSMALRMLI
ncbi:MAG TPA: hypothetical protein VHA30_00875 [Patescibacteria group bacterium]|nr:hypothetical protein [Patescibacteria group bacterium]